MLSEATKSKDEGETASKVQRSCGLQPRGRHWTQTAAKGLAIAIASVGRKYKWAKSSLLKPVILGAVLSNPLS